MLGLVAALATGWAAPALAGMGGLAGSLAFGRPVGEIALAKLGFGALTIHRAETSCDPVAELVF
jgi:hypothetical protein